MKATGKSEKSIEAIVGPLGSHWLRAECKIATGCLRERGDRLAARMRRLSWGRVAMASAAALAAGAGAAAAIPLGAIALLPGLALLLGLAAARELAGRELGLLMEDLSEIDALEVELILLDEGDAIDWHPRRREALERARSLAGKGFWDIALEAIGPESYGDESAPVAMGSAKCEAAGFGRREGEHPSRRASDEKANGGFGEIPFSGNFGPLRRAASSGPSEDGLFENLPTGSEGG